MVDHTSLSYDNNLLVDVLLEEDDDTKWWPFDDQTVKWW